MFNIEKKKEKKNKQPPRNVRIAVLKKIRKFPRLLSTKQNQKAATVATLLQVEQKTITSIKAAVKETAIDLFSVIIDN